MKKVKTKKKRKSPSREKYERDNPTVSARVSKETRGRLLVNLAKLGLSLSDALKILAGDIELKVRPIDEARQAGYEEAKDRYMVTYPCSVCGNPIPITSEKAKEAASRYMFEHGWRHSECHKRTRRP